MGQFDGMTAHAAHIQNAMVAAFFQTVAAFLLCALAVVTLSVASDRARAQDDELQWRALAERYYEQEQAAVREPAVYGAVALVADRDEGARLIPRGPVGALSFDASHLETAAEEARQLNCLAEAIYYEARSESRVGQLAVAEVVMNRTRSRHYPASICGVVYEGSERRTGCQFTFTCDGSMAFAPRGRSWARSQEIARHVLMGFNRPVTRNATHYHTVAVDPYWNDNLVRTRRIGTHIFYRFANRRERAAFMADRDA
jgi:spore germination cell wall hydrolase CwlJ-like protein